MNTTEQKRICSKCNEEKSILRFNKNGARGRRNTCSACRKKQRVTWDKSWKKTPEYVYSEYRRSAMRRSLAFQISDKEFNSFEDSSCHYCGIKLDQIRLDRLDNNVGYLLANVVPCCSTCNFLKHTLGENEFLEHIEKIYLHQKGI